MIPRAPIKSLADVEECIELLIVTKMMPLWLVDVAVYAAIYAAIYAARRLPDAAQIDSTAVARSWLSDDTRDSFSATSAASNALTALSQS